MNGSGELKKGVWIWGYSDIGKIAYKAIICEGGWDIKGIIDNHPGKQGVSVGKISVTSFDKARNEICDKELVICCCRQNNYNIFKKELRKIGHNKYIHFNDLNMYPLLFQFLEEGYDDRMVSRCCAQEDFENAEFKPLFNHLKWDSDLLPYDRKKWEFAFIIRTLEEHGMLQEGKRGIGFAVGLEPLPSYFADKKVQILATDLSIEDAGAKKWAEDNQNSKGNLTALFNEDFCSREDFDQYVSFRAVDMNQIPKNIGRYDFCWSSCAIEHVGGIELSKQFLKNMINVLRPGGIAVHTTEFNLSSNEDTIEEGNSIIFRKKDIEEMKEWFIEHGCYMETSYKRSAKKGDLFVDIPPFRNQSYHLNLQLREYAVTSFAIIVRRDT